jgi:hypothetical protein
VAGFYGGNRHYTLSLDHCGLIHGQREYREMMLLRQAAMWLSVQY